MSGKSVVAVAVVALAVAAGPARAQVSPLPAPGLTADFGVRGLALGAGDTLYMVGPLTLAPRTGYWVRFDAAGVRDPAWPEVDGAVHVTVPDGAGGWYIAGEFSHVAGQPRAGLARVAADGTLDGAFRPAARRVRALAVIGGTVYLGGTFTAVDGRRRYGLAAVDGATGRLLPWAPRLDGGVSALAPAAGTLYVGGTFTRVGTVSRRRLAAFAAATGALTAWNPRVTEPQWSDPPMPGMCCRDVEVFDLAVDGNRLYAGGHFAKVGGRERDGLAAFELATGALTAWRPSDLFVGPIRVLEAAGGTVYALGHVGEIVALDARNGRFLRRLGDADELIRDFAVAGDRVYVGGYFSSLAGRPRARLGVLSAATGVPEAWDPRPNSGVTSLVATGDGVLAGGYFSGIGGEERDGAAAIDLGTGALLPFDAGAADPFDLNAVAAAGDAVFVAGEIDNRTLAKLDARTGRVLGIRKGREWRWDANVRGWPLALAVRDRVLYVGARRGLAALDTRTGRAVRGRADANGPVRALLVAGDTLYVAGDFTRIGGRNRRHVAAIDVRSGRVTAWNPSPDGRVYALAGTGGTVYLGGAFRRVGGRTRTRLAAVDARGRVLPWRPGADAPVRALAVIDGTVYAGGDFTRIAGVPRRRLAALDGAGAATAWNPGANRRVSSLLATPAGLVAGGSFTSLAGTGQTGFAIFLR